MLLRQKTSALALLCSLSCLDILEVSRLRLGTVDGGGPRKLTSLKAGVQ